MAKRKSSAKITQREYVRKRTRRADVTKLGKAKFQPLRVADIPKEEIERATQGAGGQESTPDSYPENMPEAADNPQGEIQPQADETKPEEAAVPSDGQEPGSETTEPTGQKPSAGDQPPKEDKGGEAEDKNKDNEEKPDDDEGKAKEGEGEDEGDSGEGEDGDDDKGKKKEGAAEKEAKKGARALAKAAWQAISKAIMSGLASLATAVGWPVMIGCAVVAIIILIILGTVAAYWAKTGPTGRTSPIAAGIDDPNVKKIISLMDSNDPKLEIANDRDKEFIKSGKIDKRLAAALAYLAERHEHIRVSHIVSGYEDIKTNTESGRFHDIKYPNNISAHKNGQAADIDEIDYVKEKCNCGDKIPVKISWQTIGENPLVETPDALNQIKSGQDVTKEPVKSALQKFGVKGLDQKDLASKIQSSQVLSKIDSPYDLTDPNVISAFNGIGVTGLDNADLQSGLKRLQALQTLSEMDTHDISALQNPQVKDLLGQAGIPVSDDLVNNLEKFQAQKVISSIHSTQDLNNPEVQSALAKVGINTSDPQFKEYLNKMIAADTIKNWQGDLNNPQIQAAFATFGISPDANMEMAYSMFKASQTTFQGPPNQLNSDISTVEALEKLAIFTDNPQMQKAIQEYRAAEMLNSGQVSWGDPNFMITLQQAGLKLDENDQTVVNKYQAANLILAHQGNFADPQFQNALKTLEIQGDQGAIEKYIAANTLSKAANGELAYDSPEVKAALQTIGAATMGDEKAKAAINIGNAQNPNDPKLASDKEKIGLNSATYQGALAKLGSAKNLSHINEYSDLGNLTIANDLANLGLKDPKYYTTLEKIGAIGGLTQIHDLQSLQSPGVKNSLKTLGLDDQKYAEDIGKLGSLQTLGHIDDLSDFNSPYVTAAFANLGVKDPAVYQNLATLGSVGTLLKVDSVWDLGDPAVMGALQNLGVDTSHIPTQLSQAGSIYSLSQVKEPKDLLQPNNLQALDNLGLIDLDSEMLGQIGAIQTLMQVDSIQDLLNPNSILALNTLGIIALSNPVTIGLMAVVFLDNLMGGKLLGGLFGGDNCKATTDCYKPAAQENVYKVVEELLQMPYDLGDKSLYRVTQLITWKLDYIKQKDPSLQSKLDALYWTPRAKNVGLFSMPEAFGNIHIGY